MNGAALRSASKHVIAAILGCADALNARSGMSRKWADKLFKDGVPLPCLVARMVLRRWLVWEGVDEREFDRSGISCWREGGGAILLDVREISTGRASTMRVTQGAVAAFHSHLS